MRNRLRKTSSAELQVDDMFAYLESQGFEGTIECEPSVGSEGEYVSAFYAKAHELGLCVHQQGRHGWLLFHVHHHQ